MQTLLSVGWFKKNIHWLIAILLVLPLLWLNVRHSQHWGDDFAVYLNQARNIAEGNRFDSTTYQFIPGFSSLVPSAPVGFSLSLVPVYKVFGLNIYAYSFFLAFIFVGWALLSYAFFRKFFSAPTALIMLFASFYINFLLWLKLLITSDVLFSLLLLLVCYLILLKPQKLLTWISTGMLTGFAIHTRSIGIVILPALICHFLYLSYTKTSLNTLRAYLINGAIVVGCAFMVFFILSSIFHPQSSYVDNSFSMVSVSSVAASILTHTVYYTNDYIQLFISTATELKSITTFWGYAMLVFTFLGLVFKIYNGADFFDWVVLFYLAAIIGYPVSADYRYIAPVHSFLIFYAFYFFQKIAGKIKVPLTFGRLILLGCFALVYFDHIKYLIHTTNETVGGPYEEICQETFAYLKSNINDNDIIVFNKPRALALYTDKKTVGYNSDASGRVNFNTLHGFGARYYLYSSMLIEEDYNAILSQNKNKMMEVYKNWQFTLLKDTSELR